MTSEPADVEVSAFHVGEQELVPAAPPAPGGYHSLHHDETEARIRNVGERAAQVQAEEVVFASLVDEGITVVTDQHRGVSNYRTLDELHERLDSSTFWRVHRSHLVNINKIKEIVPWFSRNYILRMKDEKSTEIPVSRTQTRRLREYLKL